MSLNLVNIRGLRNLEPVELEPAQGVNWFYGENGAGKTSILEALYVLARGRSFRTAHVSGLIQHGADSLSVVVRRGDTGSRLGVERRRNGWRGRIDGQDGRRISEFAERLPLVLIEPDSHRLIDGGPDRRRQYLDWLLFHVEQSYLSTWQRFARLLRQRNAALKSGADDRVLDAVEPEFVESAARINELRRVRVECLAEMVEKLSESLGFTLPGRIGLDYRSGHPAGETLDQTLARSRPRDRERGFSRHGPHRADLVLTSGGYPAASEMSRGQQKLLAILLQLAHLESLREHSRCRPLVLVDDPVSELDRRHLDILLDWLEGLDLQCWVTATTPGRESGALFHVEQGRVDRML